MRRVAGYTSFVLGAVLIFLAPLLVWYVKPRIEKAPTDVYDQIVSLGSGRYFSPQTVSVTNTRPIKVIQIYKGNPPASTKTVIVVDAFTKISDPTVPLDISYAEETYAFDRTTGYAVHCCGESPPAQGVTLKFPFGSEITTYPLWDATAKKAFPAPYVRTETLDGLKTYVYDSMVTDTVIGTIDLPGFLAGQPNQEAVTTDTHYTSDTTVWIEPITGAVIKGGQHAVQWATLPSGAFVTTLADINVAYSPVTVSYRSSKYKKLSAQVKLVTQQLPIISPIIGLILLVIGFLLARPSRRPVQAPQPRQAAPVG